MWAGQEVSWLREEGLTGLEGGDKVVFVELPDKIVKEIEDEVGMGVASDSLRKGREGFGERLERHFEEVLRVSPLFFSGSILFGVPFGAERGCGSDGIGFW